VVRLERAFFYFLLFCLPFQTRLILREWGGEFNEWNSAFLYLTDLLILAILFFWIYREKLNLTKIVESRKNIILILFFLIAAISLIKAENLGIAFYQLWKLAEFVLLFFYLKTSFKKLFKLESVCLILIASALFQSFCAVSQFSFQSSLGLKFLGESPLSPNIEGPAKIVVSGVKMIRAYGTFPHPNVLAAFLLFAIFCFYFFYLKIKEPSFGLKLVFCSLFVFLVFGLFLTFSRTIIILFYIFSIAFLLYKFFRKSLYGSYHKGTAMLCAALLLASFCCGLPMFPELRSRFVVDAVDPGINLRYFYNFISISMIKESPILGIGVGNFVWRLNDFQGVLRAANLIYKLDVPETKVIPYRAPSWLFQPAHNIFLLIAAEVGVAGLLFFLVFLISLVWPLIKILKEGDLSIVFHLLFFAFLAVFLLDHFFWTLQQGRLMFWILCGILASRG